MKNTANSLCLHATEKGHRGHIKLVAERRIYFVLLTAKQGSWLQAMTFLCPEFTHPHGAELREASIYQLTVSSGMQSGHVCGIPEDDVLCFWPEVLVESPETHTKLGNILNEHSLA